MTHEFIGIAKFSKDFILKMANLRKKDLEYKKSGEYYKDFAYRTSKFIPWYRLFIKDFA